MSQCADKIVDAGHTRLEAISRGLADPQTAFATRC